MTIRIDITKEEIEALATVLQAEQGQGILKELPNYIHLSNAKEVSDVVNRVNQETAKRTQMGGIWQGINQY